VFKCSREDSGKIFQISCFIQIKGKSGKCHVNLIRNGFTRLVVLKLDFPSNSCNLMWNGKLFTDDEIETQCEAILETPAELLAGCVLTITAKTDNK
jgi:hypothetical protein